MTIEQLQESKRLLDKALSLRDRVGQNIRELHKAQTKIEKVIDQLVGLLDQGVTQ